LFDKEGKFQGSLSYGEKQSVIVEKLQNLVSG